MYSLGCPFRRRRVSFHGQTGGTPNYLIAPAAPKPFREPIAGRAPSHSESNELSFREYKAAVRFVQTKLRYTAYTEQSAGFSQKNFSFRPRLRGRTRGLCHGGSSIPRGASEQTDGPRQTPPGPDKITGSDRDAPFERLGSLLQQLSYRG